MTLPIIPGSPEQKTWSVLEHLITAHPPGTPSGNRVASSFKCIWNQSTSHTFAAASGSRQYGLTWVIALTS